MSQSRVNSRLKPTSLFKVGKRPRTAIAVPGGLLCNHDALEFLSAMRDSIADVIFLDPPFNLNKDYGSRRASDREDPKRYLKYLQRVISESCRLLKPGGALFLYHLPYWATRVTPLLHRRMSFRHWIAVSMKNGFVRGRRLYPAHYALLYYTKGEPRIFKRPRLDPRRCRHCGGLVKDYGGYTKIITKKGINLSDVWDDLSPVRHAKYKNRGANELPVLLTDRAATIAGKKHGLLLDPFVGTGTSLESARKLGMHFVGNDLVKKNLTICTKRLAIAKPGENKQAKRKRYGRKRKRGANKAPVHKDAHQRSISRGRGSRPHRQRD